MYAFLDIFDERMYCCVTKTPTGDSHSKVASSDFLESASPQHRLFITAPNNGNKKANAMDVSPIKGATIATSPAFRGHQMSNEARDDQKSRDDQDTPPVGILGVILLNC